MRRGMMIQVAAMATRSANGIGRTRRHARLLRSHVAPEGALVAGFAAAASVMTGVLVPICREWCRLRAPTCGTARAGLLARTTRGGDGRDCGGRDRAIRFSRG